jgi:hypothetical protein
MLGLRAPLQLRLAMRRSIEPEVWAAVEADTRARPNRRSAFAASPAANPRIPAVAHRASYRAARGNPSAPRCRARRLNSCERPRRRRGRRRLSHALRPRWRWVLVRFQLGLPVKRRPHGLPTWRPRRSAAPPWPRCRRGSCDGAAADHFTTSSARGEIFDTRIGDAWALCDGQAFSRDTQTARLGR